MRYRTTIPVKKSLKPLKCFIGISYVSVVSGDSGYVELRVERPGDLEFNVDDDYVWGPEAGKADKQFFTTAVYRDDSGLAKEIYGLSVNKQE